MRLISVNIKGYKNLRDITVDFDQNSLIDVFVGKNGSGKSNFFEALIEIFQHLHQLERRRNTISFDYKLRYKIGVGVTEIEWANRKLRINQDQDRRTLGETPFPKNIIVYYSGHNPTVTSLVARYEKSFRWRISRGVTPRDSRLFIGIGAEYKSLLLAVLLTQDAGRTSKQYVMRRLGIVDEGQTLRIVLKRPINARARLRARNVKEFDPLDRENRYWAADEATQGFVDRLVNCISGDFTVPNLYDQAKEHYTLDVSLHLFQREFSRMPVTDLFRQLDNLKTIGMLEEITLSLTLSNGQSISSSHFSDGQFQSVYIYAITTLFSDRDCLTLLDEPDSFLHPEWQFDFLKQVSDIIGAAGMNNHILLSSHSASTIMRANEDSIRLFEIDNQHVTVVRCSRATIVESLSAGMITVTAQEAHLNITKRLSATTYPVLFTEGITDQVIVEKAWRALYGVMEMPFIVQQTFGKKFLQNLFSRDELRSTHPARVMFALFDFDDAYDEWNGLSKARDEITNPYHGLCKQLEHNYHYAMLLPVPNTDRLRHQALKPDGTPWGRGIDSHIAIEHLFYEHVPVRWFVSNPTSCGGQRIEFQGDKVAFAERVVSGLENRCFGIFRHMFDFIRSKCPNGLVSG